MKKFTLIAALAAITFGAFATERQTVINELQPRHEKVKAEATLLPSTADEIQGIYWLEAGVSFSSAGATIQNLGPVMINKIEGNKVSVKDFCFSGLEFTATFNPRTQTLTFPLGQSSTGTAVTATIYEFDWRDNGAHEVKMLVDTENRVIRYQGETNSSHQFETCIVLASPGAEPMKQVAARIFLSYLWSTNSTMQYRRFDAQGGGLTDATYVPIYVEPGENGTVVIDNFLGRGFLNPVSFVPDKNNLACYAMDQTIMADGVKYYIWSFDANGTLEDTQVGFEGYYQNGDWAFLTGILGLLDENGMNPAPDGIYYDVAFLVPYDPFASVENVEIDNSNAPVEYFNLQGMPVANPENGLYIRRQGNKAEKVYIR